MDLFEELKASFDVGFVFYSEYSFKPFNVDDKCELEFCLHLKLNAKCV